MSIKRVIMFLLSIIFLFLIIGLIYFNFIREDKVLILGYHDVVESIAEDPLSTVNISLEKFEEQIKWLKKHNYISLTMDEFYEWKVNNFKIPKKSVLITFDDGWKSVYTKVLPILEKYDMKASVFVIWKYASNEALDNKNIYINLEDIKDMQENHKNIEILSHSYDLHSKESADSNDYELYYSDMKKVQSFQKGITYYAYPYGSRNNNYIKALKDNDYKLAFTFGPYDFARKSDDNYQIPRFGVFESTPDWKFKLKLFLEV